MTVSLKDLKITLAADGGKSVYQKLRRLQGFLDDANSLADAALTPSLSQVLSLVDIGGKRAGSVIQAEAKPSGTLAAELDNLVEAMANGYGREIKESGRGKTTGDPLDRLDAATDAAETMRDRIVYLLAWSLAMACEGNVKKVRQTVAPLDLADHLVEALVNPEAEQAEEPEAVADPEPVNLKKINNIPAKPEKVTA